MIYFLYGENSFARDNALAEILDGKTPEKLEGETLEKRHLPDIFAGQTLFAAERLIVLKNASQNLEIWTEVEHYLDKIDASTTLIFVETKPDKRTRTYKILQKIAKTREFSLPKNAYEAQKFAEIEAQKLGLKTFDAKNARFLIERVGFESWAIFRALEKLALADTIDDTTIAAIVEAHPSENVFALLETALKGESVRVHEMCKALARTEEPYRVFGLLTSQILQLTMLVFGVGKRASDVAADMKVSPFVLNRLAHYAAQLQEPQARALLAIFATADKQLKSTTAEPWVIIEATLLQASKV